MTGPAVEPEVEALAVLEEAVALLLNLLGWGVALGVVYTYNETFHKIFQFIANALTQRIPIGFGRHIDISLGGWANDLDHKFHEWFTTWAAEQEKQVGMWWYALGWTVNEIVVTTEESIAATARAFDWVAHTFVPTYVAGVQDLWKNKSNKAAAAAGAAGALVALLRKTQRAEHQAEQAATQATKAAARAAGHEAHQAKSIATTVETTVVHETKVITQVVDVGALPAQFGQTVKQIRRRLGRVEALFGATAMAVAMANVLGIPSWRCLTKGPLGRISRALCGLSSRALEDLLGLLVDVVLIADVCEVTKLLNSAVSLIEPEIVAFVTVAEGALCHGDFGAPPALAVAPLSLPPVTGLTLSLA